MSDILKIDPSDLVGGRIEFKSFPNQLAAINFAPYKGKHVQLEGCSPVWAHLMLAGKLFQYADAVDFIIDDGKDGKVVEIFRKS